MRVSVTAVDGYRYYRDSESMTFEGYLARLEFEDTPQLRVGRAIHRLLERADQGLDLVEVEQDGLRIRFDLEAELPLPATRELKLERQYEIDGDPVTVVGKVDVLDGDTVEDHKTTSRFDAERLADSMQWRAYLDMTGCRRFRWNVFEVFHRTREDLWIVKSLHRVEQCRYPGMAEDWLGALSEYVRFAREFLEGRERPAAPPPLPTDDDLASALAASIQAAKDPSRFHNEPAAREIRKLRAKGGKR
jgi:hypothetical protein